MDLFEKNKKITSGGLQMRNHSIKKTIIASALSFSLIVPFAQPLVASANEETSIVQKAEMKSYVAKFSKAGTPGDYRAISSHFLQEVKVTEQGGQNFVTITASPRSAGMIPTLEYAEGQEAKRVVNEDQSASFTFPVTLGEVSSQRLAVKMPGSNEPKWYYYELMIVEQQATTPEVKPEEKPEVKPEEKPTQKPTEKPSEKPATSQQVTVKALNGEKNEVSTMQNFMKNDATVRKVAEGYEVDLVITQGNMVKSLTVNGTKATVKDLGNNQSQYTFKVKSLEALTPAKIHVVVNQAGVNYDTVHDIRLTFAGKTVEKPTQPEVKPQPKPEEKPVVKPQPKPEAKPATKPEQKPTAVKNTGTYQLTVLQDQSDVQSTMQNFVSPQVKVTKVGNKYKVELTVTQPDMVKNFSVNGKEAVKSVRNGLEVFTFEVANINQIIPAKLHVVVDTAGVKYDTVHDVRFKFTATKDAITGEVSETSAVAGKTSEKIKNPQTDDTTPLAAIVLFMSAAVLLVRKGIKARQ